MGYVCEHVHSTLLATIRHAANDVDVLVEGVPQLVTRHRGWNRDLVVCDHTNTTLDRAYNDDIHGSNYSAQ
jgi:hypothetical protein